MLSAASLLALAALAAPAGLEKVQSLLAAGDLDSALLELQGQPVAKETEGAAADLMAEGAARGLKAGDPLLALQFAQMSLKLRPAHPKALEAAARAMLAQSQLGAAESYADRLLEATGRAPAALLLRAQIALEQGEWGRALELARPILGAALATADERRALERLRKKAAAELAERKGAAAQLKTLEERSMSAAAEATKLDRNPEKSAAARAPPKVVLYGVTWCGYCRKARQWLNSHGVPFEDRDIEADSDAARELEEKKASAHLRTTGVPVVDFGGTIVAGFDEARYQSLLDRLN